MDIYVYLNSENQCLGWSSTESDNTVKLELSADHSFLSDMNFLSWTYVDGDMIKDNSVELRMAIEKKDKELNNACDHAIRDGFIHEINGVEYHFSCDNEAQMNFQNAVTVFDKGLVSELPWTAKLNGEYVRVVITADDMLGIMVTMLNHKNNNIARYRDFLVPILEGCESVEEVESIVW